MRFMFLFFFSCLFAAHIQAGETSHPFSVRNLVMMERISEPRVSPDGRSVLFAKRVTDLDANKGITQLWVVGIDGSNLRALTDFEGGAHGGCWSPDGRRIFFISSRSGSSQVWKIPAEGGDAVQVTDLPLDVSNLVLSRDGEQLALTMEVFPGLSPSETRARLDEIENQPFSGRIYERLFVRLWDTWMDGRRTHIFVMPAGGGDPVGVMKDMDADSPSRPWGGPEEFCFTPDGKHIVFTAKHVGRAEAWSTDYNLFLASVDGKGPVLSLTAENPAWDTQPVFSPDGRTLAYLAMARPGYESDRFRIMLMSWPDKKTRVLTEDWDRSPGTILWSPDGKTLYATADHLGQRALFAVDVRSGRARTVIDQGTVRSPQTAGGRIVYGCDHLKSPVELYVCTPDGKDVRRITQVNTGRLAKVRLGEPEQFTFQGWNDATVYGYVVKPVDLDPGRKYPVAFLIHGGPQGSFGNDFHYRWNPQTYAGAGYAAVMVDFHGSTGYGQAFTDAINNDWGGKPLVDLQKGLAAALDRYPWMDGDRVAALGASYGGYMIYWIAGNWPDRFRCLVSHDGNLDNRMAYFDTEELWFPEWDHQGTPWSDPEHYEHHNPVRFVDAWQTPTLVVHGARDFRVVETQGLGAFNALQRRGIPSKLLYFPDENHWVLKPHNSIQWHDTVIEWLDRWCRED